VAALMAASVGVAAAKPGKGKPKPPKQVVVNGVATSVDAGAGSFVLHRRGGKGNGRKGLDVTVTTNADTKFKKSDGTAAAFDSVVVNLRVQVKGVPSADGVLAKQVLVVVPEADSNGPGDD
jgi:hypothetical protein